MNDPTASPLYPARLDRVQVLSPDPAKLCEYYRSILGGTARALDAGEWFLAGPQRKVAFAQGPANKFGYAAFALGDRVRLARMAQYLDAKGVSRKPAPAGIFGEGAFAVSDPDGNRVVFGDKAADGGAGTAPDTLPGRLQHCVVATADLAAMMAFYGDVLGFKLSDRVLSDDGAVTAAFYRSDDEHHSFACFRAPTSKLDHFCFETTCWNDIRDWADHLATLRLTVGWGPGRHGPGDNLFFMLNDPDGNAFEFSAELERMAADTPAREWPHEARTLNYWGPAWMRS